MDFYKGDRITVKTKSGEFLKATVLSVRPGRFEMDASVNYDNRVDEIYVIPFSWIVINDNTKRELNINRLLNELH